MVSVGTQGVVQQVGGDALPAEVTRVRSDGSVDICVNYKGTPFFRLGVYPETYPADSDETDADGNSLAGTPRPDAGKSRAFGWFQRCPVAAELSTGAFFPIASTPPPRPTSPAPLATAAPVSPLPVSPTAAETFRTEVRARLEAIETNTARIMLWLENIDSRLAPTAPNPRLTVAESPEPPATIEPRQLARVPDEVLPPLGEDPP